MYGSGAETPLKKWGGPMFEYKLHITNKNNNCY